MRYISLIGTFGIVYFVAFVALHLINVALWHDVNLALKNPFPAWVPIPLALLASYLRFKKTTS